MHTPLQLQQLDLEIDGRREIGLLLAEPAELRDLPRFAAWRHALMGGWHGGILAGRVQLSHRLVAGLRVLHSTLSRFTEVR